MALLECPDCHGQVSSTAAACPHCGWRNTPAKNREPVTGFRLALYAVGYLCALLVLAYVLAPYAILIGFAGIIGAVVAITRGHVQLRRRSDR